MRYCFNCLNGFEVQLSLQVYGDSSKSDVKNEIILVSRNFFFFEFFYSKMNVKMNLRIIKKPIQLIEIKGFKQNRFESCLKPEGSSDSAGVKSFI